MVTAVEELTALLGDDRVRTHPLDQHLFAKDAGLRRGGAAVVVFPETSGEVAAVVKTARAHGMPIVARGAGTGLAGGAVPQEGWLLVVLTRMNRIFEIDEVGRTAWVGPGVVNLDLSQATAGLGLHFAPDPSSQSACTVGGNVATNAGGPHCLAEGSTVAHILGVELVTADGNTIVVGGEAPDTPGYDLRGVIVGSEGTLGIVTRVLVRLTENPPDTATLLMAFDTIEDASRTVSDVIAAGMVPAALEMMDNAMCLAVENFVQAGYPTDAAAVLLADVSGHPAGTAASIELLTDIAVGNGATSVRVATDASERALLWKGRKSAFGAVAQAAPDYYLNDTVVPRTRIVEVISKTYEIAERYGISLMNVFHAGDGNLHPLVSFDAAEPGMTERVVAAAREMVIVAIAAGGTLSGEHGIGVEKRDLMSSVFSAEDLDAQARLREAFDPDGALNPEKVLPDGARCFDWGTA
ncbi:MAG: FAD-linked oxidase C-terminal domain-containing protein [Acidimicrobiia bacterium]|nr:MAG: FAD-linked oxidase C-terminal domain-containing protein [Acidimicrobiia bacterium]